VKTFIHNLELDKAIQVLLLISQVMFFLLIENQAIYNMPRSEEVVAN